MATVSQICQALASEIPMPLEEVKKYARALINSGDLPKAVGRSIPELTMQDRAKLILAIAACERPSACVKAMRDRYNAPHRFGKYDIAGEVLAEQLREIAEGHVEGLSKWTYSDIEVSRTGDPRVKFRINENLRHFDGFQGVEQPEFIGGTHAATSTDELTQAAKEYSHAGLEVSAFIPGHILIVLAFGSRSAAFDATAPIRREAWRRHNERRERAIEQAKSGGAVVMRGTVASIKKQIAEGNDE